MAAAESLALVSSILGIGETLFGTTKVTKDKSRTVANSISNSKLSGESRDRLDISDEAVDKIVSDILSGPDGLASIFGGEQNSGIFNSSVAAEAAGNLTSKITGEIAKLRAERIQTQNQEQTQKQNIVETTESRGEKSKRGLIGQIFG